MPIFRGKTFVSADSVYKDSVRLATRSTVNLSGSVFVIDGKSLTDKNRVLLAGQTDQKENGIFMWSSATSKLTRALDADSIFEISPGMHIYCEDGNSLAKTTWTLISTGVISPGVNPMIFAMESRLNAATSTGTFGSANKTLQVTVDETGQVDSVTEMEIDIDGGSF
jgi:phage-related tail fiber protein